MKKMNLVRSKHHRTLLLARYHKYQKCKTIIISNFPLKFPKKPLLYVFLEHLHGVDAQGKGSGEGAVPPSQKFFSRF